MEGDFDGLFELAAEDRSVSMLESIFGGVIALVETGTAGDAEGTWLNTAINFFNLGCLLLVVLITIYTVLTLVLDTAKDGATFGQQTDTRYTMFRVIAGAIFFIPVSGGFTIAQVALLWLVVQGSALADSAWNRIAASELDGNAFISPTTSEQGVDDLIVRQEFARALDALVVGNLCAQTLNDIATTLTATDPSDAVTAVGLIGDRDEDLEINEARFRNTSTAIRNIYFTDISDSGSYRSSNALCGGVSYEAPWAYTDEDPDTDAINTEFFRLAMTNAARARMSNYTETIVELNTQAASIATIIRGGAVEADDLHTIGLTAVDAARISFVVGAREATTENVTDAQVTALAARLQDKVSADGWVMAAAWQRGISRAIADQRSSFSDFELDVTKESNVERFLRPRDWNGGWFSGRDATTDALLSEMEISMEAWSTVAPRIVAESRGRASDTPTSLSSGGAEEMSGALGSLAELMIYMFSPRGGTGYSDPMVDITEYGFGLIKIGGGLVAAGFIADVASGAMILANPGASVVVKSVADYVLYPVGWALLMSGFIISSILPLIPVVYFLSAVASWLILVVESMFAIPLAVLTLFTPSRDNSLIGSWNKILLSIFGIFLRPLLTIIGLFAGMLLIAVVLDFSYDLFRSMVVMVSPTASLMNIFSMLGVVMVSVIVSFYVVLIGSKLITEIGDGAMNWLSIPISSAGQGMNIGQAAVGRMGVENALPNRMPQIGGGGGGGGALPPGGGGTRPPAPSGGPTGGGAASAPAAGATRAALGKGNVSGAKASLARNSEAHGRASKGAGRDAAFRIGTNIATRGKGPK